MIICPVEISDLRVPNLRELHAYWADLKGDRNYPLKDSFNPAEVPHLLSCISLYDIEENPRRFRARLVGTDTVKAMGYDFTGKYLDEITPMNVVSQRFNKIAEDGIPYLYQGSLEWSKKSYLDYHALALPFSKQGNGVEVLMYGSYYFFPEERSG